jgi:hypothetical protein
MEIPAEEHIQRKIWRTSDAVLLAAALVLMIVSLGAFPLGNDEAAYVRMTSGSWGDLLSWLRNDNIPPLWPALMKLWQLTGASAEWALRLPSVFFAMLFLACFIPWARRFLSPAAGEIAIILVALSPFLLFLGQLAKYFSLLTLLAFLAVAILWKLLEDRDRPLLHQLPLLVAWGISLVLLLWLQYIAAAVWAAAGLWLLWVAIRHRSPRAWVLLALQCTFFIGFLPWVGILAGRIGQMSDEGPVIGPDTSLRSLVGQAGYTFYAFAVGHTLEPAHVILAILGVGLFGGALALALWRLWSLRSLHDSEDRLILFLTVQCAIMLCVGFLILRIFVPGHPILSYAERLVFVLPFMLSIAAYGAARLRFRPRMVMISVYMVIIAFSLFNMITLRENNQWEYLIPWREIRAHIQEDRQDSIAVVVDNWHMGSRGWYYLQQEAEELAELRWLAEDGALDEIAESLSRKYDSVYFVRSIRDSSPDDQVNQFGAKMESITGRPCAEWRYVTDSHAMLRLKKLLRRGSATETYTEKVALVKYCPRNRIGRNTALAR